MDNSVNSVEIQNFKSIKNLTFEAKRINVFIGKPNVGKSNILEALTLLGPGYSSMKDPNYLKDFLRFEETSNLYYDDDINKDILVSAGDYFACLKHFNEASDSYFLVNTRERELLNILKNSNNSRLIHDKFYESINSDSPSEYERLYILPNSVSSFNILSSYNSPFKKYDFKNLKSINHKYSKYLVPPDGNNLFWIVYHNPSLTEEIGFILDSYGLQFTLYQKEGRFEIEKKVGFKTYKYPYSSLADTLQRLIFYYAAIDSNENSILILEEPEVHAFPPYTRSLGSRIVNDKKNQYFITTHSPYLLESLMENPEKDEMNIFLTYYENYETKLKLLSTEELNELTKFGYDIYFNLDQLQESNIS